MSTTIKMTMPVESFRRTNHPFEQEGKRLYQAIAAAKDLPEELAQWRDINPRDPRTSSGVAKKIAGSLNDAPENFLFRNRGITLLVERATFNNEDNTLSLEFADPSLHGLLDGGHTYAVIQEAFSALDEDKRQGSSLNNAYIKLEILEGFREKEEVIEIVGARNTSTQVKDQSLENLLNHFAGIKEVLADEPYANRIAYKESELSEDGSRKDIDIKEVLSYLVCFDREGFDDVTHPIIAYSGKTSVLSYFTSDANRERLQKYLPLLPQILELRDKIYEELPKVHNANGGKFGRLNGVNPKKLTTLPFSGVETTFSIPSGFIYPVLAAFRTLVDAKEDKVEWKRNPVTFFNDVKAELVQRIVDQALTLSNPNKLGKDKAAWRACYDYVAIEVMRLHL